MTKIILASTAAVLATLSFASTSEAGWRHRNHYGVFNVVIDAPRYTVDEDDYDAPTCYVSKTKHYNRYGDLVVEKVRVCD
jgi:hypothetical protein